MTSAAGQGLADDPQLGQQLGQAGRRRADAGLLGVLFVPAIEHRPDDLLQEVLLLGRVPDMPKHEEVGVVDLLAPVEHGRGDEELEQLDDPAIGQADPFGANLEDQAFVGGQEFLVHGLEQTPEATLNVEQVGRGHARRRGLDRRGHDLGLERGALLQQPAELVAVEVVAPDAEQEAVEEGRQGVVGGDLVAGGEHRDQGDPNGVGAVGEAARVEQGEQAVEDRPVGLEDLVEERDLGLGQHALDPPPILAGPKGLDVDRPEDLVGLGEAGQQVVVVLGVDRVGEGPDQRALGRAGWADHDHVLAGEGADEEEPDDLLLAEELRLQLTRAVLQSPGEVGGSRATGGRSCRCCFYDAGDQGRQQILHDGARDELAEVLDVLDPAALDLGVEAGAQRLGIDRQRRAEHRSEGREQQRQGQEHLHRAVARARRDPEPGAELEDAEEVDVDEGADEGGDVAGAGVDQGRRGGRPLGRPAGWPLRAIRGGQGPGCGAGPAGGDRRRAPAWAGRSA